MEALGIDWKIIVVQIINFGLLVFVLNKYLYKPVLKAIRKKNEELSVIEKGKEELEERKKEVEIERDKIIKAAQEEKSEILKDARLLAAQIKKESIEKAEKQAKNLIMKSKADVEAEKKCWK